MASPTRSPSRSALLAVMAVIAAQLAVFALVWSDTREAQIRDVPVSIAAPPIVADGLATDIRALKGGPFDPRIAKTPADAQQQVKDGVVVAALAVDLVATSDTLYVSTAQGQTLIEAVIDRAVGLELGYGRTMKVVDLVPAATDDGDLRTTRLLVFGWMLIGFAAAAGIALSKGIHPPSRLTGLARLAGLAGLGVGAGVLGAITTSGVFGGSWLAIAALGTLTTFTAGATTMAFQSLFGLAGIGIATVVFLMLAGPDVIATHSWLLPQPWPLIDPWVPHGASTSAAVSLAYFGGYAVIKPLLVLGTWALLAVAISVLSRRESALAEMRV